MLDPDFWWDVAARLGPPILAGTIVAALLQSDFGWPHGLLIAAGFFLMAAAHWQMSHRD